MRLVNIYEILPEDIVAQNVYGANGSLIVKAGMTINAKLVNVLNNNKIMSLYVTDDLTEQIKKEFNLEDQFDLKDVIDPHLRRTFNQNIKKRFEAFKESKGLSRYSDEGNDLLNMINHIASKIVGELSFKKDPMVSLTDIKHLDIYDYEHSVNTAVLSVLTGLNMGYNERDLLILAKGSLLMNIGNEFVMQSINKKTEPLNENELSLLKKHTIVGRELLADNTTIEGHVKNIVLNHHERLDGSGYPRGIRAGSIDKYSKIVMIADVYDAMTSDRVHRKAYSPNEALEFIMGASGLFDHKSTTAFTRNIIPYPIGEYIALSNGDTGLVIDNNKNLPLRPVVRVLEGLHINQMVDLSKKMDLVITRKVKRPY